MKYIFITILSLGSLMSIQAQDINPVKSAFSSSNAAALASILSNEIELCIGDDVEFLSKQQTISQLNKWFSSHTSTGISGRVEGSGAVKFYNGTMKTADGSYRVIVYYKKQAENYVVDEIRITSSK